MRSSNFLTLMSALMLAESGRAADQSRLQVSEQSFSFEIFDPAAGSAPEVEISGITITGGTYVGANNQGGTYSGFDTTSAATGERLVFSPQTKR